MLVPSFSVTYAMNVPEILRDRAAKHFVRQ
jgi:hypothetical protein